jgi:MFS family permease
VLCLAVVAGGALSDRVGRGPVFKSGLAALALVAFPFFWVADGATAPHVWLAMLLMATPLWLLWGALPAYFCEQFPEHLRYTGISLGSQAATIIGGLVPLFATAVLPTFGTWPISALIVVSELLAIASIFAIRSKSMRSTLAATTPRAQTLA